MPDPVFAMAMTAAALAAAGGWLVVCGLLPRQIRLSDALGVLADGTEPDTAEQGPVVVTDPTTGASYRPVGYVDAMEDAYAAADLMVGRAGAGTVMETATVGLPVIFVPLPHGNGEQARNAGFLVAGGAGLLVDNADFTADRMVERTLDVYRRVLG